MYKQAQRIIDKFGGAARLAAAIEQDVSSIYKWNYTKEEGGTDGLVPSSTMPKLLKAAEVLDVKLTSEELDPR